jgi:hypothetical protein
VITSTIDIVTLLPGSARERALGLGTDLCGRMLAAGIESAFTLGSPFPGAGRDEVCEPHVSLFMLEVVTADLPGVVAAIADVARAHSPFAATGTHVAHNPQGAPELFFKPTAQWRELQRAVIDRIEPARHGLLRPTDPAGQSVAELIRDSTDRDQVRQLSCYGYDEVYDDDADRFRPHVTLAWPALRRSAVDLSGIPAGALDHVVSEVAVAEMHPYGTCTAIRSRSGLVG